MSRTILIVDDNERFRARARSWLERAGFVVVGEAADGESAIAAVRSRKPEVVLLDIQLPDSNGISLSAKLKQPDGSPAVVLTSTRDLSDFGDAVGASAAAGFVPKAELSGAALEALL